MADIGFSDALLLVGANAMRSAIKALQLHTDDPGTGGATNRSSAAPQTPAWTTPDGSGNWGLATPLPFTGCTPNGPIAYASAWSGTDLSTATWYGNLQLSGDLVADANGDITVETLTVTGSSS